jgi:hypothetical protein
MATILVGDELVGAQVHLGLVRQKGGDLARAGPAASARLATSLTVPADGAVEIHIDADDLGRLRGRGAAWSSPACSSSPRASARGIVMMNMISSTSITSINGVVFISTIMSSSPLALPTFIPMVLLLTVAAGLR